MLTLPNRLSEIKPIFEVQTVAVSVDNRNILSGALWRLEMYGMHTGECNKVCIYNTLVSAIKYTYAIHW